MDAEHVYKQQFSDVFLRDVVVSFLIAGRDTTACTLSWLFLMLGRNPEAAEKLSDEIRGALPSRNRPSCEAVKEANMPFLNGVVWETLRLYPPVPATPKVAAVDDTLPDG